MSRRYVLAVFVVPAVLVWWHMPWYVWFMSGVGAVVGLLILAVQASDRQDVRRARAGLQPFNRYVNEPVRYRIHPDDLR